MGQSSDREEMIAEEETNEDDVQDMGQQQHEEGKEIEMEGAIMEGVSEEFIGQETEDPLITSHVSENEQTEIMSNINDKKNDRRKNRTRDYSYCFAFLALKSGIQMWGEKAIIVMRDELQLLLDEEVFEQIVCPTEEQKKKSLRMHCFVV
jgi:hypothetical protein